MEDGDSHRTVFPSDRCLRDKVQYYDGIILVLPTIYLMKIVISYVYRAKLSPILDSHYYCVP